MAEKAILFDATKCIACRACQVTCKQWNELHAEKTENEGGYDENLKNRALFAQYQWQGEYSDIILGSRTDERDGLARHTTNSLTLGWKAGEGRLYLSHGTAFKAPTFLQRYYPTYGNPNLLPEESVTTELGYRHGALQLALYNTQVENLIEFDWPAGYSNLSNAHLQGLEIEHHASLGQWHLNSGITLQKSENKDSGERLLRRAEKRLNLNLSGPLSGNSNVAIEFSYTGPRMDRNDVELVSYTLLNLSGEYRFSKQWSLSGRIENLLDEEDIPFVHHYRRLKTYLCRVAGGSAKPGHDPETESGQLHEIVDVRWLALPGRAQWDDSITDDPVTFPLLQRIRAVLGYV